MDLHSNATHIVGGLRPPPGIIPNFANPESLHTEWILSLVTCFFPPTFFVFIRAYTKLIIIKSHGWEDCKFLSRTGLVFDIVLILDTGRHCLYRMGKCASDVAYFLFLIIAEGPEGWQVCFKIGLIGYLAISFVAFENGGGVHQWNVPIEQVKIYAQVSHHHHGGTQHMLSELQAVNAKEIANGPVLYITKLSILLQFMRIFVPHMKGIAYYIIQITIWLNLFYYLAATLVSICTCIPRRKIWEPWTPGRCLDISKVICVSSIINVISDVMILMIPLFCVSSLQMPLKQKIGISVVFATAIL